MCFIFEKIVLTSWKTEVNVVSRPHFGCYSQGEQGVASEARQGVASEARQGVASKAEQAPGLYRSPFPL